MKSLNISKIFLLILLSCENNTINNNTSSTSSNNDESSLEDKNNGQYVWKYSNGKQKLVFNWLNNRKISLSRQYYSSGQLKSELYFANDTLSGPVTAFYRNGHLKYKTYFKRGIRIGRTAVYDSTGKLKEVQLYDNSGRMVYLAGYYNGIRHGSGLVPIINSPDTVKLGNSYKCSIQFAYPLTGKTSISIGNYIKNFQVKGIFYHSNLNDKNIFTFSYKPQKKGSDKVFYQFKNKYTSVDSLSVDGMSGSILFYVK